MAHPERHDGFLAEARLSGTGAPVSLEAALTEDVYAYNPRHLSPGATSA
jgi:hypothetical protein